MLKNVKYCLNFSDINTTEQKSVEEQNEHVKIKQANTVNSNSDVKYNSTDNKLYSFFNGK